MQVGVPVDLRSTASLPRALAISWYDGCSSPQVRFISLAADYFPLVAARYRRHRCLDAPPREDGRTAVKELRIGLLALSPTASPDIHWLF